MRSHEFSTMNPTDGDAAKKPSRTGVPFAAQPAKSTLRALTPASFLRAIWRFRAIVALWTLGLSALAVVVILALQPLYRAQVLIALDTSRIQFAEVNNIVSAPNALLEPSRIRSEIEVLGNDTIVRRVIQDLHLDTNPEFVPPRASALEGLLQRVFHTQPSDLSPQARMNAAVVAYHRLLNIFNDGRSYIVTVTFEAHDPALATAIVNAHIAAYVDQQRGAKYQALDSTTRWLNNEIDGLSARLRTEERAAEDFRTAHNLYGARGTTSVEQQLSDTNAELTHVQNDLATAKANNTQAQQGDISAIFASDNLRHLQAEEAELRSAIAQLDVMAGGSSTGVQQKRAGLLSIQQSIQEETRRIRAGLRDQVTVTQQHEAALHNTVAALQSELAATEQNQNAARRLELQASTTRSLFENLLARQKQVLALAGIQQPDAHVVSWATEPDRPSFPRKTILVPGAALFALISGVALALLLNVTRPQLDSLEDMEADVGLRALGAVPLLRSRRRNPLLLPTVLPQQPRSVAAESVRTIRAALSTQHGGMPTTLAVTSSLPGEGKTSIALALARSLAGSGLHVLLVEADLRRGRLGQLLWPRQVHGGIVGVLRGKTPLAEGVREDPACSLHILAVEERPAEPQDLLDPRRFRQMIAAASEIYDYVIVDTPPVSAVSDALLVAQSVAATLVVIRAKGTPAAAAAAAVRCFREAALPVIGGVLNGVDPRFTTRAAYPMSARVNAYLDNTQQKIA